MSSTTTRKTARRTKNRKAVGTTVAGKTCLTKSNRLKFIADHKWAQPGMSTRALAEAVLNDGKKLTGNWAIGPRRTEVITGKPVAKTAKTTKVTVAKVTKAEPAKVVYRRANGTIAPKVEYPVRATLEAQGFSPKVVDKRTRKAMKALASV